jgi:osmotically-inducible protein OsmY
MRKYGRWMLALGIMAGSSAVANAQSQFVGQRAVAGRYASQAPQQSASYNQQMAEQIAGALRNAQLRGYDVEIEFKEGVAVLQGKVKDSANKANASRAVQALQGVKRVDNRLQVLEQGAAPIVQKTVAPPPPPEAPPVRSASFQGNGGQPVQQTQFAAPQGQSNQQVAQGIASALSSAGLQGYDVDIRFQDGTAVLAGSVGTPQQRAMAQQITSQVSGVRQVSNQLQIAGPPIRRTAYDANSAAPAMTGPPPMAAPGMPGPPMGGMPMGAPSMGAMPGGPSPMMGGIGGGGGAAIYGSPNLPDYAWPSYAQYPNSAAITYPKQYSASAWPYIGPYYPYPQVPLGWRQAQLEWDDGHWQLSFNKKTDKWFWFMQPKNWGNHE